MDVQKMMGVLRQKHGATLDPDDSIFLLATIADELQKEGQAALADTSEETAKKFSEMLVLADTNVKGRSEKIIRDATQFSTEKIRLAGVDAANSVAKVLEEAVERCEAAAQTAVIAAWISSGAAAVCVVAVGLVIGKVIPLP